MPATAVVNRRRKVRASVRPGSERAAWRRTLRKMARQGRPA